MNDINIHKLQAPCTTFTIDKAPTPGFILTADKYEGIEPFTTILRISYPAGANQIVRIVNSGPTGDSCLPTDITLDGSGNVDIPYSVTETHVIYVIQKAGTGGEDCCTTFSQTLCTYSNYIRFEVPQVIQAGFGGASMILLAGLAIGALYLTTRKKERKSKT